MHHGTFPPSNPNPAAYRPATSRPEEMHAGSASRRQWLFALGGVLIGLTVPASWSVIAGEVAPGCKDRGEAPQTRGEIADPATPRWALDLADQPSETVIKWAGDLEMVAARHRTDARLISSFERLLDVVLVQRGPTIDAAGACAIRGLERLGASDVVTARRRQILARRELSETREAMTQLMESAGSPSANK